MRGAEHALAHRQQRGQLVAGAGRIARLTGPSTPGCAGQSGYPGAQGPARAGAPAAAPRTDRGRPPDRPQSQSSTPGCSGQPGCQDARGRAPARAPAAARLPAGRGRWANRPYVRHSEPQGPGQGVGIRHEASSGRRGVSIWSRPLCPAAMVVPRVEPGLRSGDGRGQGWVGSWVRSGGSAKCADG
jgi:hypothetical protein